MLQQLVISNLAVIDSLELEFKAGMTVLTGETGAGKSILLDALGLILGDRADSNLIRGDADKTEVTAIFTVEDKTELAAFLAQLDIELEDELYIRRVVAKDGRSKAYLNNTPVPVQTLREVGEQLIDIHGQHAHQSLSKAEVQRDLVDEYGQYDDLLTQLENTYDEFKLVSKRYKDLTHGVDDSSAKISLLRYQIDELDQLNLKQGEYKQLKEDYKRLANAKKLIQHCQRTLDDLSESDNSIRDRISEHQRYLNDACELDVNLKNISSLLDNAFIQIEEAGSELRDYIDQFDGDTSQLQDLEKRIDDLNELARKHKLQAEQLPDHLNHLRSELDSLLNNQDELDKLQSRRDFLKTEYFNIADKLHAKRLIAAKEISKLVTAKMHELGMSGEFVIEIERREESTPQRYGLDKITFSVSTNPGQPVRPITKVASGGELSRLSLAIQIISSRDKGIPTMIFDEVDSGISGGIAEIVGKLLFDLAKHRQIFCVTHLAQVASCGHHHLHVIKTMEQSKTFTTVKQLDQSSRVTEVARMLAGVEITDESLANARQMLKSA